MPNPWDIRYSARLRPGDKTPDAIYLAVGRALTKWEGLEAAMLGAFVVVTGGGDQWHDLPLQQAFGAISSPASRADMIIRASKAFFWNMRAIEGKRIETDISSYEQELKDVIRAYTGWMARRNDLAHGYVTESSHPDYAHKDQPIVTTYSLCPSHTNSRKWGLISVEPTYHYIASEIDNIADAFEELDTQVSDFVERFDHWRKAMLSKLP